MEGETSRGADLYKVLQILLAAVREGAQPIQVTSGQGALWLQGQDVPEARERFHRAMERVRNVDVRMESKSGEPGALLRVGPLERGSYRVERPRWWSQGQDGD